MTWLAVAAPAVMAVLVVIAHVRERGAGRRVEEPPEAAHPAEVAWMWSAYEGDGGPDAAFRAQLLHLAREGIVEIETVGSLSDPEDLILVSKKPPAAAGPDPQFTAFLFPAGESRVSLRQAAEAPGGRERLSAWYLGLRLATQGSVARSSGGGLLGLVRMARGLGDAFMGSELKLGARWSRPEAILAMVVAAGVGLWTLVEGPFRQGTELVVGATWIAAALAIRLMPQQLPRDLRRRMRAWRGFRKYLKEFASLPDAPTAAVAVWERHLVYAVALDVADEVEDQVRALVPEGRLRAASGGGMMGMLGLGWLRTWSPANAAMIAQAMQPLAQQLQRAASSMWPLRRG